VVSDYPPVVHIDVTQVLLHQEWDLLLSDILGQEARPTLRPAIPPGVGTPVTWTSVPQEFWERGAFEFSRFLTLFLLHESCLP
jgi:hypothetical protein